MCSLSTRFAVRECMQRNKSRQVHTRAAAHTCTCKCNHVWRSQRIIFRLRWRTIKRTMCRPFVFRVELLIHCRSSLFFFRYLFLLHKYNFMEIKKKEKNCYLELPREFIARHPSRLRKNYNQG